MQKQDNGYASPSINYFPSYLNSKSNKPKKDSSIFRYVPGYSSFKASREIINKYSGDKNKYEAPGLKIGGLNINKAIRDFPLIGGAAADTLSVPLGKQAFPDQTQSRFERQQTANMNARNERMAFEKKTAEQALNQALANRNNQLVEQSRRQAFLSSPDASSNPIVKEYQKYLAGKGTADISRGASRDITKQYAGALDRMARDISYQQALKNNAVKDVMGFYDQVRQGNRQESSRYKSDAARYNNQLSKQIGAIGGLPGGSSAANKALGSIGLTNANANDKLQAGLFKQLGANAAATGAFQATNVGNQFDKQISDANADYKDLIRQREADRSKATQEARNQYGENLVKAYEKLINESSDQSKEVNQINEKTRTAITNANKYIADQAQRGIDPVQAYRVIESSIPEQARQYFYRQFMTPANYKTLKDIYKSNEKGKVADIQKKIAQANQYGG